MNLSVESHQGKSHAETAIARSRGRQAFALIVFLALIVAAGFGYRGIRHRVVPKPTLISYASVVATDPGTVAQVLVHSGQMVRKGELLAVMNFGPLEAQREQAQQEVLEAIAGSAQGNQAVAMPIMPPAMTGSLQKRLVPTGKLPPPMPVVKSSNVTDGSATNLVGKESPSSPLSGLAQPLLNTKDLQAKIKQEEAALKGLQQSFTSEQDAANTEQELVNSLAIAAQRTKADSDKSATLLAEGVISANDATKAQVYAQQAEGQLDDAKVHAAAAQASLADTQQDIDRTTKQIQVDKADLKRAESAPPPRSGQSASAPPRAQAPVQSSPQYKLVPVPAPSTPGPPPAPVQVQLLPPALETQRIEQAEARLEEVGAKFASACIYAPADGEVVRVSIKPGAALQANQVVAVIRKK